MSNKTIGTQAQSKQLDEILSELKSVKGSTMMAMQKAQEIYGYLPEPVQIRIAEVLDVPLEEVYGIVTFYTQFHLQPRGKYTVGVCLGTACYVRGSGKLLEKIETKLKIKAGETTTDGKFTLDATRCIGCCGLAPVMTVGSDVYGKLTEKEVDAILDKYE